MRIKNIILITIDALRQDSLGCYGYKKNTSPFIDKLAKQGIVFKNVFSTAPFTPPSFISLLTSSYPLRYGSYIPFPKKAISISEIFKKQGFSTSAFVSNVYTSRYYNFNRGFDYFQDYMTYKKINKIKTSLKEKLVERLNKTKLYPFIEKIYLCLKLFKKEIKPNENADKITNDAIKWLRKNKDKRFFMWLHYMDVHIPYFPPKKYRNISKKEMFNLDFKIQRAFRSRLKLSKKDIKKLKDLYDSCIRYVDDNIKNLASFLKKNNLYKDTLIVITSDHVEEFYEHGDFYHK